MILKKTLHLIIMRQLGNLFSNPPSRQSVHMVIHQLGNSAVSRQLFIINQTKPDIFFQLFSFLSKNNTSTLYQYE